MNTFKYLLLSLLTTLLIVSCSQDGQANDKQSEQEHADHGKAQTKCPICAA